MSLMGRTHPVLDAAVLRALDITPNLRRIAQERGVHTFLNGYCPAPVCAPSRCGALLGVRPTFSGIKMNPDWPKTVASALVSMFGDLPPPYLPAVLKQHGFRVFGGGKVGHAINDPSLNASFDVYFTPPNHRSVEVVPIEPSFKPDKWPQIRPEQFSEWCGLTRCIDRLDRGYYGPFPPWGEGQGVDHQVLEWAGGVVSERYGSPFALFVGFTGTHKPWLPPERNLGEVYRRVERWLWDHPGEVFPDLSADEIISRLEGTPRTWRDKLGSSAWFRCFDRRFWNEVWFPGGGAGPCRDRFMSDLRNAYPYYLATVMTFDEYVGRLYDTLMNGPNADNTIVVIMTDQGLHWGDACAIGEKESLYPGAARDPIVIRIPPSVTERYPRESRFAAGREHDVVPASQLDVYPTLLELLGFPRLGHLQGESLVGMMQGLPRETPVIVEHTPYFLLDGQGRTVTACSMTTPDGFWQLNVYPSEGGGRWNENYLSRTGALELFHLPNDPRCLTNLAGRPEQVGRVRELLALLQRTLSSDPCV